MHLGLATGIREPARRLIAPLIKFINCLDSSVYASPSLPPCFPYPILSSSFLLDTGPPHVTQVSLECNPPASPYQCCGYKCGIHTFVSRKLIDLRIVRTNFLVGDLAPVGLLREVWQDFQPHQRFI